MFWGKTDGDGAPYGSLFFGGKTDGSFFFLGLSQSTQTEPWLSQTQP